MHVMRDKASKARQWQAGKAKKKKKKKRGEQQDGSKSNHATRSYLYSDKSKNRPRQIDRPPWSSAFCPSPRHIPTLLMACHYRVNRSCLSWHYPTTSPLQVQYLPETIVRLCYMSAYKSFLTCVRSQPPHLIVCIAGGFPIRPVSHLKVM
jgi:hypothetical protein